MVSLSAMMRSAGCIVTASILLAACIPSAHPFYTTADIVFAPALEGTWGEGSESWTFERDESGRGYALTIQDDDKHGLFEAVLFEIDGHRFLDLHPGEVRFAADQIELVDASVFPGHMVMHVAAIEPRLKIAFFDVDWFEDMLEADPSAMSHAAEGNRILLTGNTAELQAFLLQHVDGGELFSDYGELSRQGN